MSTYYKYLDLAYKYTIHISIYAFIMDINVYVDKHYKYIDLFKDKNFASACPVR